MAKVAKPSALGLRIIRLLEGLSEERLQSLAVQCTWRRYEPDQLVVSRDGEDRAVHLVVSGPVRITIYSATGRQVTFNDEKAGAAFGELAAIDGKPRTADAVALESLLIASMPPAVFKQLLREESVVLDRVLLQLTTLVRRLSDRVIDLSTMGVQNRVHAEVLRLAREAGVVSNRSRIDPAPKHTDIASRVSTYREQVTRELSVLTKCGILAKDAHALVVADVARLEQLVKGGH
jgi:CRP/FNR family cyclic AMP-dependent transcriptional regulator